MVHPGVHQPRAKGGDPLEQERHRGAVLQVGGVHLDFEQPAQRVDRDAALAAAQLRGAVVAAHPADLGRRCGVGRRRYGRCARTDPDSQPTIRITPTRVVAVTFIQRRRLPTFWEKR
jgi:hypothetical protein